MKKFFFDYDKEQHHFSDYRLHIILLLTCLFFLVLFLRLFFLSSSSSLSQKREERFLVEQGLPAWRYDIVDRHQQPLALSYRAFHIGMNPQHFHQLDSRQQALLRDLLELSEEEVEEYAQKTSFSYFRKHYELSASALASLSSISFIQIEPLLKRFYPLQEATAPLLGFTDDTGRGLEGLELVFNEYLAQKQQDEQFWRSPRGEKKYLSAPDFSSKTSLELSIDSRIQQILYEELKRTFSEFDMDSLSAVVLDPQDFSALAIASYPSINPQKRPAYSQAYRLLAAEHAFEPGSVIKPLTLAFLAEKDQRVYAEIVKTSPGYFSLNEETIRDVRDFGTLSFEDILRVSSNVGVAKLVLKYSQGSLLDFWKNLALINGSQIEFYPESFGDIPPFIQQGSFSEALLGYGYGMKMNLLQLAQLYGVIAGDGTIAPLTCLAQRIGRSERQRVFQEETVAKMRHYLKAPVQKQGTARRAHCKDISIAGKTGTVRKLNDSGQYDKIYNSYFVSFFPADNPKYVIALYAENPRGKYYGGLICAPMVKRMAKPLMCLPEY